MKISSRTRNDFPQLKRTINGKPIVYLDSTATSLKPQSVIDKEIEYYTTYCANIFRGIYTLSEEATAEYESVRVKIAKFIGAAKAEEIIFTRNTTESINLVAEGFGKTLVPSDEIVSTIVEHHSNFVPWQQQCMQQGSTFRVWNINSDYHFDLNDLDTLITRNTKLLAISALSNVLGIILPVKKIVQIVKRNNPRCLVFIDAAQAVPHTSVNVGDWGADFVAFSSHKMLGPTGVGVLWGKMEHLEALSPYQYGGEMIQEVHVNKSIFKNPPHKFEAGTPNIAGVIGLGKAVEYLTHIGMEAVRSHEVEITDYALRQLKKLRYIKIVGPSEVKDRGGVIAFTMTGAHAHDVAQILNEDNICIRAGNHCAMPLHEYLGIGATARASFYIYSTKKDVDAFIRGLEKINTIFS